MNRREFIGGLGSAAAWSVAAGAQQPTMPVVGYLNVGTESFGRPYTATFHQGLSELGYVEGRNVDVLYRWAEYQYDRLPALAADLVRRPVAVIFATGNPAAPLAAKSATSVIPIVFQFGADPVDLGLVTSLSRPGGNVTGVTMLSKTLTAKRLELLHEIVPAVTSIALLVNPTVPAFEAEVSEAETAARILGVRLEVLKVTTPNEIEAAFAMIVAQRIGALVTGTDSLFGVQAAQITELAARHKLPWISALGEQVKAGGLMSYGASLPDAYRLAGSYVGRVLKGDKPADLPVQQSTRTEMLLNLRTAKALSIEVPTALLLRADEVIE